MPLRRSFLVARMVVLLEDAEVRVAAIYDIHGNLPALEAAYRRSLAAAPI